VAIGRLLVDAGRNEQMTLFAVVHDMSPEELLTKVTPHLPSVRTCTTSITSWGAVLVVNALFSKVGRWLVVGLPQACPWGVPGIDLPGSAVASELDQHGPAAIQMVSGPVVAVDLSTGAVLRALNGIIPVATTAGGRWAASSSRDVVTAITGTASRTIGPGCLATPDGATASVCGSVVEESIAGVTWSGVDAEIQRRLEPLGPLAPVGLARGPGVIEDAESESVRLSGVDGRAVFVPKLAHGSGNGEEIRRYLRLRDEVLPRLWWRAWLVGLWLCAPSFERPALDLVSMAGNRPVVT
jgi:hypothetical protein